MLYGAICCMHYINDRVRMFCLANQGPLGIVYIRRACRTHLRTAFPQLLQKGLMEKRIMELAIEALERRRAQVDAEIEIIRGELEGGARAATTVVAVTEGRRPKTAEERKAHSLRMKKIWAARKAADAKPEAAKSDRLRLDQEDAANQARSEKMKAYWAKRKAQKARKNK